MGDKQQPAGYGLRVIVDVGGPDRFFYDPDFETAGKDYDQVMVADGLIVYIDQKSYERFREGTIDYVETADFSGFHFDNPHTTGPGACTPLLERVQWVIDTEINPELAGHGGAVELAEKQDNNCSLRLGGGCHGCSAGSANLKVGIEAKLREKFPDIREIINVTDHAAGVNPIYA